MRNLQNVQIRTGSGFETVCPFPIGAIYQSTSSTSPASIYGGGWSALTDGRFLRPQGSWNNLGGENTHKLTIAEMPSHQHRYDLLWTKPGGNQQLQWGNAGFSLDFQNNDRKPYVTATGGNAAHNNVPAYRTCYCWYRTS